MEDGNLNILMAVLTNRVRHPELVSPHYTKPSSTLDGLMTRSEGHMNVEEAHNSRREREVELQNDPNRRRRSSSPLLSIERN